MTANNSHLIETLEMPTYPYPMPFIAHLSLILFVLSFSPVSYGHDYWLAPEDFSIEKDLKFRTKMFVGSNFKADQAKPLSTEVTGQLELHTHGKAPLNLLKSPISQSKDGYTEIKVSGPSGYWLMTERNPTFIELEAKKFEKYLRHENLHDVIEQRRQKKESQRPGRERYSRSIKTYLSIGDHKDGKTWKMRVPQRLEINPQVDPREMHQGQKVSFQILLDGKPLDKTFVNAIHTTSRGKAKVSTSKTDDKGVVTFLLKHPGAWLIRLVHMRRCMGCKKADWESFWGALTLEVQPTKPKVK